MKSDITRIANEHETNVKRSSFNHKNIFARARFLFKNKTTSKYNDISSDSELILLDDYNNGEEWVIVDSWSMALKVAWYEARKSVYKHRILAINSEVRLKSAINRAA